jgi:hypothetical protein
MYKNVKLMAGPPLWQSEAITIDSAPNKVLTLYYQDLVGCTHYLFSRLNFVLHMEYAPVLVHDKNNNHVYHEMNSGDKWHAQQVRKIFVNFKAYHTIKTQSIIPNPVG